LTLQNQSDENESILNKNFKIIYYKSEQLSIA